MRIDPISTIARPYAAAAFAEALAENKVSDWGMLLNAAALMTENLAVRTLLGRPGIAPSRLSHFYCEVLAPMLSPESTRFLELLATYRRLPALPEIARLYQARREIFEKKISVRVISAIPLEETYQKKLSDTLTRRLERQILLECEVDASLMGGAIVKIGDKVLDGSVRGKLQRMIEYISGKSLG